MEDAGSHILRPYRCEICSRDYESMLHIRSHMSRSHAAMGPSNELIENYCTILRTEQPELSDYPTGLPSFPQMVQIPPSSSLCPEHPSEENIDILGSYPPALSATSPEQDSKDSVADDVFLFYSDFNDSSSEVHGCIPALSPSISSLNESCTALIQFVTQQKQTVPEMNLMWSLISKLETNVPEQFRFITKTFQTSQSFSTYVSRARKWKTKNEGWRSTAIKTKFGTNETGVFRSTLDLLVEELEDSGGIKSIVEFQEARKNGVRVFEGPCSSNAMKEYAEESRLGTAILGLEIYCDGTTLARSGSQSATLLRVRFTNIQGKTQKWHDIGISPRLLNTDIERTKIEKRTERLHLSQRFLFIAMQDVIKASKTGLMYQGTLLFPRVVGTVADQPQERLFFGLKSAGSFRDCSECIMKSTTENRRRNATILSRTEPEEFQHVSNDERAESALGNDEIGSNMDLVSTTRQTQLSGHRMPARCVSTTVRYQLIVARSRLSEGGRRHREVELQMKSARTHLKAYSALEFPPALAAFHSLGTKPFHLYRSIEFDKLHAVDLGILRSIPDLAFKGLGKYPYETIPVSQQVKIINQRLLDMPKQARLPHLSLFRYSADQQQAGMSGGIRRKFAPFLWVALMGISESVPPDEDPLVQACLSIASCVMRLTGVNENPENASRSENDIEDIQLLCFDAGAALSNALDLRVSTKLHRLMYHVADHLYNFGCLRRGATDENEALHKEVKAAYHATNAIPSQVSLQLLSSRQNLFPPQTVHPENTKSASGDTEQFPEQEMVSRRSAIRFAQLRVRSASTVENSELALVRLSHMTSHQQLWTRIREVRITPKHDWWPEFESPSQNIFAGENIHGSAIRRDSVEYRSRNESPPCFGIVQAFFKHALHTGLKVALIRPLIETKPDLGNEKVVYDHGNKRLKYKISNTGDIEMELVPVQQILRLAMVVPDTYDVSIRHGRREKLNSLPDNPHERQLARFFEVRSFQFTSLREWTDESST